MMTVMMTVIMMMTMKVVMMMMLIIMVMLMMWLYDHHAYRACANTATSCLKLPSAAPAELNCRAAFCVM